MRTPLERGGCCYFRDGYKLSKGIDLELTGRITPQLQLAVGYTYNSNEDRRKDDAQFSTTTPRHLFKAWADYRLDGELAGWSVGGGVVTVVATGGQEIRSITIKPEAIDPDDVEMLQDMLLSAVNEALQKGKALAEERMGALTGGMGLPPGLGF